MARDMRYYPIPNPWGRVFPVKNTPIFRQAQIGRLTSSLIHLANGGDYPAMSYLPELLSAFSSREGQIEKGIWAYFHPLPKIPRLDEIRDLGLPPPMVVLPKEIVDDIDRPWVSVSQAPARNNAENNKTPRYRLLFFLHRFLYPNINARNNSPNEVFGFSVWDREHNTFRYYDFWPEDSVTRQIAVTTWWARALIMEPKAKRTRAKRDLHPPPPWTPPNLYPMIRQSYNSEGASFGALATIASHANGLPPARISMYACIGAALEMMNRIADPAVLVPSDEVEVLTGLREDLIPKLFDEVLAMLRDQPKPIKFVKRLPRNAHELHHDGQPFLEDAWVKHALSIPDIPVNALLRLRLRRLLSARARNGKLDLRYVLAIVSLS